MRAVSIAALCALLTAVPAAGGEIVSIGSDTMGRLVAAWGDGARERHPELRVRVESRGSATAPGPLTRGESQLGPMSRRMTDEEERAFREATGRRPLAVLVALDALAVYVHSGNGLRGLTIRQLDGIFSATQECRGKPIRAWRALVFGPLAGEDIRAVGRDGLSGTTASFREEALCGGNLRPEVERLPDSAAVISVVASDRAAIGFAGLGFRTPGVKVVSIADHDDAPYVSPLAPRFADDPDPRKRHANVISGRYPLSRGLWIYVDKPPDAALPGDVQAFLDFVLSEAGQAAVEEVGFVPLDDRTLLRERRKLAADYTPRFWSDWRLRMRF